jgi:hypothetical protein
VIVDAQTTLKVTNRTGTDIRVYLTLGRADGCVQDVKAISFVTDPVNPQQGWFILGKGATKTYTPPQGQGISGNFAFGSPPLNCPTTEYPNGINLAEFMLNNNFQGPGAQETIDISCVAGANALIAFAMTGGGGWNGGNSQPNVAQFASKALGQNTGLVGVYPCGCDNCTSRNNPPQPNCPSSPPPPAYEECQAHPICNVQRDAGNSGRTVKVSFQGFLPN